MEDTCSICLMDIERNLFTTSCGHNFHTMCFTEYRKKCSNFVKCPICRTFISGICSICLDTIGIDIKINECRHEFHRGCYETHQRTQYNTSKFLCPCCIPQNNIQIGYFNYNIPNSELQNILNNEKKRMLHYKKSEDRHSNQKKIISEQKKKFHNDMREKFLPKSRK